MEIIFTQKAKEILKDLILALDAEYFSFHKQSLNYIDNLKSEIRRQIDLIEITSPPKAGQKYQNQKYGYPTNYIRYKANATTTWYILIKNYNNTVFITHIHHNKSKIHSKVK